MSKLEVKKIISSLRSIDDLIFLLNNKGVFIEYFQKSNDKRLYTKPKRFLGQHYNKVLPKHVAKNLATVINKIKYHKSVQSFDYLIVKSGQEMWFEARVSGVYTKNELLGFVGVVRDITKRKFAEEKIREHCGELGELKKFLIKREIEIIELKEQNNKLKKKLKK